MKLVFTKILEKSLAIVALAFCFHTANAETLSEVAVTGARADLTTLEITGETNNTLFQTTTLVTGTSLTLTELNLQSAGTLLVQLTDMEWPDLLDTLSFTLADASHVLSSYKLDGVNSATWTIDVLNPGTLYASIFAKPDSSAKAGMYNVLISYQSVTPVPLPAALWFLVSGIAGMVAIRPKHKLSQSCA